jgi:2-amino-4-hydroxy-6-hydroxymethyldihydropteridine diphosphokinase
MGGNLPSFAGLPEATLTAAAARLEQLGRLTARSSLWSTKPVGFAGQPRFVNAVVELETDLAPRQLLEGLLAIEHEFGRDRAAGLRNGPRTLDLDILLFGDLAVNEPGLEIPHPRLTERIFALQPLAEIAPSILHKGHGRTVQQLLHHLRVNTESREDAPIAIHWDGWPAGASHGGDGAPVPGRAAADQPHGGR